MPVYEYQCGKCGKINEVMQKFSDAPLTICPDCGGSLKKLISHTSFILKGTGWYVTDYASADRKQAMSSEKPASEDKTSDQKTESKTDTATASQPEPKAEPKAEPKTDSKKDSPATD